MVFILFLLHTHTLSLSLVLLHRVEIALIRCANQNIDFSLFLFCSIVAKGEKAETASKKKKQYSKQSRNV